MENRDQDGSLSRQAATSRDDYALTIDEALVRYEHAGHPRTVRSLQRYCARGDLDCLRQETTFGEKYLITPASVARHLAQIEELASATGRDTPRPVASIAAPETGRAEPRQEASTTPDQWRLEATASPPVAAENGSGHPHLPRQGTTGGDYESRYVERLEGEVSFLRDEISTKNSQIKELTERSRETNLLVGGLQRLLAPLLGSPDPYPNQETGRQSPEQHP